MELRVYKMKVRYDINDLPKEISNKDIDIPVAVEIIEHDNNDIDINVLPDVLPLGANLDLNFVKSIREATSREQVKNLIEGWVNV